MNYLKEYGDVEGPLGLPMRDAQAQALEILIKDLKELAPELCRSVLSSSSAQVLEGERADVSWITTEDADRQLDIIVSKGIKDDHFKLNPVVALNHKYELPPVGRSLWRKAVAEGARSGIKAKTIYPTQPDGWSENEKWMPDLAYGMVQKGLLNCKSIGFLPLRTRMVTPDEVKANPSLSKVRRVVEECVLLEYSCCPFGVNQYAVVEQVSKALEVPQHVWDALGIDLKALEEAHKIELSKEQPHPLVVFTPLAEIEKQLQKAAQKIDPQKIAEKIVQEGHHRARGGV
jgi:hypothetical protein